MNLEAKEMKVRFDTERHQYQNQLAQLKQAIEAVKGENEKLSELINQRKGDHQVAIKNLNEAREHASKSARS
eukprot:CAMPEP_0114580088 /NCGR_PEP_ID=MMETSP0125-20121206/4429_1 /TAXON_ID=485358 ORGANISM="Aristerostoma sp., Strain ATCC 50986" /NCGR_SAMPLE_ID=MMETSP0125 /ASSEMBLY_ACC=CAM_ASM_000245 /LENGTH=71 /DNA_ID=CAMNT_0001771411 /DNA_START=1491 /DNA_END=1706 /DNA_ORIENTATION=+